MAPAGRMRSILVTATCTMLAITVFVGVAAPAGAVPPPPPNPSDQQIQASQTQASSSAAEVGRLSGLVTSTEGDIRRLNDDLELKGELYKKALIDEQLAQADAVTAQAAAQTAVQNANAAGTAIATAQQKAAEFAAASFRQGSVLGSMSALMDASSASDLLARQELLTEISKSQLDVIAKLQTSLSDKANLDSDAKVARDNANAASAAAVQATKNAASAKQAADDAFVAGQAQLATLNAQLNQQQNDYELALSKVSDLQHQRAMYNKWLAAKKAEEERLRLQAIARAKAAAAAKAAAEKAAAEKAAAEAAAAAAERARLQAEAQAAAQAAAEQAAAQQAAAQNAARVAQQRYNNEQAQLTASAAATAANNAANAAASQPASVSYTNSNAPAAPVTGSGGWTAAAGLAAVAAAEQWVGTPYSWGGGNSSGPTLGICGPNGAQNDCNVVGFDCSGLTSYAWAQQGISIPRLAAYQYTLGQHVAISDLLPGDLLFYANDTTDPSTIHHVTIYAGNGMMVEAPYSGAYVHVTAVDFGNGYIGATRVGT